MQYRRTAGPRIYLRHSDVEDFPRFFVAAVGGKAIGDSWAGGVSRVASAVDEHRLQLVRGAWARATTVVPNVSLDGLQHDTRVGRFPIVSYAGMKSALLHDVFRLAPPRVSRSNPQPTGSSWDNASEPPARDPLPDSERLPRVA